MVRPVRRASTESGTLPSCLDSAIDKPYGSRLFTQSVVHLHLMEPLFYFDGDRRK